MNPAPDAAIRPPASPLSQAFLRIPPFPGAKIDRFEFVGSAPDRPASVANCIDRIRELRVGGTFWGAQPELPQRYVLVRSAAGLPAAERLPGPRVATLLWLDGARPAPSGPGSVMFGVLDPWHMLAGATGLICDAADEVRFVAAVLGIPTFSIEGDPRPPAVAEEMLPLASSCTSPFGGERLDLAELVELCGFWRSMIDSNRGIACAVGFAAWKQDSVLPLLWGGGDVAGFFRSRAGGDPHGAVAVWRAKASRLALDQITRDSRPVVEVEDGFLRSNGLGADCIPPLSITVDRLGAYFDPGQPSELEQLLQDGQFDEEMIARAARLRARIVAAGLGKYERGHVALGRFHESRRHILVTGQVEDDRSVMTGGSGLVSNLELLKRVRAREPDAYLIYKPHPDVVAGHRKGGISEGACREVADRLATDESISSLIQMVDEVHVNTSLAGFEALMRGKKVTTYGVPFYAGWGLTSDLGPVPARRSTRRSLDELVAATLLVYPRYLDPVSGLPCPAEVVVDRLCGDGQTETGLLVAARRLQGKLRRRLQRMK